MNYICQTKIKSAGNFENTQIIQKCINLNKSRMFEREYEVTYVKTGANKEKRKRIRTL